MYGYDSYVNEREAKKLVRDYSDLEYARLLGSMTDNEIACGPLCSMLFIWRNDLRDYAQGRTPQQTYHTESVVAGFKRIFDFGRRHGIVDDVLDEATIYQLIISDDEQTSMGLSELMRAIPLGFCGPDSMRCFVEGLSDSFPMDAYRDEFGMYLFEDACRRDLELWGKKRTNWSVDIEKDKREYVLDVEKLAKAFGQPISRECVCNIGEMLLGAEGFKKLDDELRAEEEAIRASCEAMEREDEAMLRLVFGDDWVDRRMKVSKPQTTDNKEGVNRADRTKELRAKADAAKTELGNATAALEVADRLLKSEQAKHDEVLANAASSSEEIEAANKSLETANFARVAAKARVDAAAKEHNAAQKAYDDFTATTKGQG